MPTNSEPEQAADTAQKVAGVVERIVVLPKHLHARPAGQVAQTAGRHQATTIELVSGGRRADARSVLAVMALGAVTGGEVRVIVAGPDATTVADDIVGLLERPEADE
jgi:phosphotransferase system HPr (HPr) family protein